jgi:hypothetical protein
MGAIQNELNQLLGTTALVAGGAKKVSTDAKLLAKEKAEAGSKEAELAEQQHALEKDLKQYKEENKLIKKGLTPMGEGKYQTDLFNQNSNIDMKARKLAMKTAIEKIESIKYQRSEYQKLIGGKK